MEKMETKVQEVAIGKINLPVNSADNEYVPSQAQTIVGNVKELETIALGIQQNLPVLLVGDTGSGKTSFIRHLAFLTHNGFRRINLNGNMTTDELVGHHEVTDREKGMQWIKGPLYEAMEQGYWLLLDELNAALPEVLFVLQSVLDDDKFLPVPEHHGEIIRPHANFRLFATMNPSMEYAGTRDLNKALLSRFPIVIQTHYPDAITESEIIKSHVPNIKDEDISVMIRIAEEIRKGKQSNTIGVICSTRDLIHWAKLSVHVGIKEAAELAVLNKCELDTDKKTVEDIFKMLFGKWEKGQVISLTEIENQLSKFKEDVKKVKELNKEKDRQIAEYQEKIDAFAKVMALKPGA